MQKQHNQATIAAPTCEVKFGKWILIVLNVILLILGIISLSIGAWSLNDEYGADNIEVIMDTSLYTAGSVILIVGGVVTIITSVLGGVGSYYSNRMLLGIYFGIMVVFGLLFIIGAIVAFFFLDEVEDSLADRMEETLTKKYYVNIDTTDENRDVTNVWNDIQKKLKCCGVRGGLTGTQSWFLWQSSEWFDTEGKAHANSANWVYVPSSCCNSDYVFEQCQELNADNTKPPQKSTGTIANENRALYHTGCLDALEDEINDHIAAIVTVAILILLLIIACAVLSMLVLMEAGRICHVV